VSGTASPRPRVWISHEVGMLTHFVRAIAHIFWFPPEGISAEVIV